ncbi:hypothetical protein evm_011942 [Chilo suppressalis]|nr:hypothetical protein evm_011942 [Chilo suppressalis]
MWLLPLSCLLWTRAAATEIQRPNIVFIVADDLGWDDVSYHGSDEIMTPNIDTLAYQGVILDQYYTDSEGSASRSALFTGKYPMRMGLQGVSIRASEDRGIPVSELLLPVRLRELGYKTHLVGKWGVGKSRAHYLPTNRGFDSFYGFTGDSVDYLTYNTVEELNGTSFYGLDFFENLDAVEDKSGYLTDIITDKAVDVIRNHNTSVPLYLHLSHATPHIGGGLVTLQPPLDSVEANKHIVHSARRLYAGLVTTLDNSVGNIIAVLAERDILQNTIIVFVSDNGAPTLGAKKNFGSNYPLRGTKGSPWEGGVRSIGLVWHAAIMPRIHHGLIHATDWLPTLVSAAGGRVNNNIDGINQWSVLINNLIPKRRNALITIDDLNGWAAFREGDFKIIIGDVNPDLSRHYGNEFKRGRSMKESLIFYDDILLASEAARVFKEILQLPLDVISISDRRADLNLTLYNQNSKEKAFCLPTKAKGCLFNISSDPTESNDLWTMFPDVVRRMSLRLRTLWTELKARRQPQSDPRADPSLRNYTWYEWIKNEELNLESPPLPVFPMYASLGEMQYLVDLNFNLLTDKLNVYIGNVKETISQSVSKLFYN